MENLILTFSYFAIGILLKGVRRFPKDFSNSLNLYVIYVALPALVLWKVPKMELRMDLAYVVIVPWAMIGLSAMAVVLLSRIFQWNRSVLGCLLLMVALGNTSFLGIPMVNTFFGEHAIAYAMLYDQLGSFLGLATYGTLVLALVGDDYTRAPGLKEIVHKIVTFPPFVALILGFITNGWKYPVVLELLLQGLGTTLVPVVMVAVGYQLSPRLGPGLVAPLFIGLFLKLILAPLAALTVTKAMGIGGEPVRVAIFEAGMPPMVSAGALAIMAGLAPRLTAALVGLGIPLSFITLPILYKLL